MGASLALASCSVDLGRHSVHRPGGDEVRLTTREAELLAYLAARPSQTVTRDELLREVWGYAETVVSRAADHAVRRLREKIEADPGNPVHVLTVFGTGYRFEPLTPVPAPPPAPPPLPVGGPPTLLGTARVDLARQRVERDGEVLPLTAMEAATLGYLLDHSGRVVPREEFLREVWQRRNSRDSRAVDVMIGRLRSKIEPDPGAPRFLVTVRGGGYRLDGQPDEPGDTVPVPHGSRFVGRSEALARVEALLGEVGTCTVTGPPGIGKTRLCAELASRTAARFPGGAWWCDLAHTRSRLDVLRAVASRLGALPGTGHDAEAALVRGLANRGVALLVLDNFEQVAEQAADLVAALAGGAPEARILVTSRARLGLPDEQVFELDPLSPEEALALFEDRARQAHPGLDPAAEREVVAPLVERLDRIPLAIVLAAARMSVLSARDLLDRLGQGLGLLADRRGGASRHGTLVRAIEWSWGLLEPWEQAALAQLSVFRGGFSIGAAEAVLDLSPWPEAPMVVDVLQALRDHSLLHAVTDPDRPSTIRLDMYMAIREVAAAHRQRDPSLEAGTIRRFVLHHAAYGAPEFERSTRRHGGVERLRELAAETDNLLAAVEMAPSDDPEVAARCAVGAVFALELGGPFSLAVEIGRRALTLEGLSAEVRAWLAWRTSNVLRACDEHAECEAVARAALPEARAAGGSLAPALLNTVAFSLRDRYRLAEARAAWEEAAEAAHRAGDDFLEESVRGRLAAGRDPQRAEAHLRAAVRLADTRGDAGAVARTWVFLGKLQYLLGRLSEAVGHYDRAIPALERTQHRRWAVHTLAEKANALGELGRLEECLALRREVLGAYRGAGLANQEAEAWMELGYTARLAGRLDTAWHALQQAAALVPLLADRHLRGYHAVRAAEYFLDIGDLASAQHQSELALSEFEGLDHPVATAYGRSGRGLVHLALGELGPALEDTEAAVHVLQGRPPPFDLGVVRSRHGRVLAALGRDAEARAALAEAEDLRRRLGAGPSSQLGQEVEALRAVLEET